jgi:uncharacterized protein YjbI with pentapeptide repeats
VGRSTILTDANLRSTNFTGATFLPSSVEFNNRRILGGDFSNAQFTNATMEGVEFMDSTFTGVTWDNTTCPDGTNSDNNGNTCIGHFTLP